MSVLVVREDSDSSHAWVGSVLVQVAVTNYPRLVGLNNIQLFLTVLEDGKSKVKVPADPGSGERLVPGLKMANFLLHLHMAESGERRQSISLVCFLMKSLISFMRALPNDLITSQRPHPIIPSHRGLGFQHRNFGGTHTFSPLHSFCDLRQVT